MIHEKFSTMSELAAAIPSAMEGRLDKKIYLFRNNDHSHFRLLDWQAYRTADVLRECLGMLMFFTGTPLDLRALCEFLPVVTPDGDENATN